jgi:AcrR family transcriptional regulator
MSPRTPQQFQEIREEKMTLIMDVALGHFANEGYFRTTINHIARHAGISKGLMYNYFESKEALLKAIIHRSVNEIYKYLDINRDGRLSEEEFEFFIRKMARVLTENRFFWRLMMQLLTQSDVREKFFSIFPETDSFTHPGHIPGDNLSPLRVMNLFKDYFVCKKENKGADYDPEADLDLFILTLKGFAVTRIYSGEEWDEKDEMTINRIIERFK